MQSLVLIDCLVVDICRFCCNGGPGVSVCVCLFVRDSRLNYAKYSHQSLRDYRDLPGRTTPRIGVTRPAVSMAFPVYFRYSLCGRPPYFNYGLVAFPIFTRVFLQQAAFEILTNGIPEYTQAKRIYLKGMTKIGR